MGQVELSSIPSTSVIICVGSRYDIASVLPCGALLPCRFAVACHLSFDSGGDTTSSVIARFRILLSRYWELPSTPRSFYRLASKLWEITALNYGEKDITEVDLPRSVTSYLPHIIELWTVPRRPRHRVL